MTRTPLPDAASSRQFGPGTFAPGEEGCGAALLHALALPEPEADGKWAAQRRCLVFEVERDAHGLLERDGRGVGSAVHGNARLDFGSLGIEKKAVAFVHELEGSDDGKHEVLEP